MKGRYTMKITPSFSAITSEYPGRNRGTSRGTVSNKEFGNLSFQAERTKGTFNSMTVCFYRNDPPVSHTIFVTRDGQELHKKRRPSTRNKELIKDAKQIVQNLRR